MIGIPVNRNLSPKFAISLQKVIHYLIVERWTVDVNYNNGTILSSQRNKLLHEAYKEEMNLMFIDSDMIFSADDFIKVYNASTEDCLVGGLCFMRRPPFQPVCFAEDKVDTEFVFTGHKIKSIPIYPFKCAAVGCAFLFVPYALMSKIYEHYDKPFNNIEMANGDGLGEDLSFFYRCNKIGIETICVPGTNIGHLSEMIIYRKDHEAMVRAMEHENDESE